MITMKRVFASVVLGFLLTACDAEIPEKQSVEKDVTFNQELVDELEQMAKMDQIAVYIPQGKYKELSNTEWKSFKDSVLTTHQKRLKQLFDRYGFVGFDLAGEDGSHNFWLMVQHSDHTPEFQKEVLKSMEDEVAKGNAKASNFAYLTDRVRKNSGQKQIYGTQVTYNMQTGQAYPRSLEDSLNVNIRRKTMGLEPIENYLNQLTEMHFEMNKERYVNMGIIEPNLYKID
ncbi:MAG: DUF6624 domain-containing protein [Calditrichia bacterium]